MSWIDALVQRDTTDRRHELVRVSTTHGALVSISRGCAAIAQYQSRRGDDRVCARRGPILVILVFGLSQLREPHELDDHLHDHQVMRDTRRDTARSRPRPHALALD